MAVILPTITEVAPNVLKFEWANLLDGVDEGSPIPEIYMDYLDRVVQVKGTFGAGGTVSIQGSNHGGVYTALNDLAGTALTFTSAGVKQILELPLLTKPILTAGEAAVTDLTVIIVMRRTRSAQGV